MQQIFLGSFLGLEHLLFCLILGCTWFAMERPPGSRSHSNWTSPRWRIHQDSTSSPWLSRCQKKGSFQGAKWIEMVTHGIFVFPVRMEINIKHSRILDFVYRLLLKPDQLFNFSWQQWLHNLQDLQKSTPSRVTRYNLTYTNCISSGHMKYSISFFGETHQNKIVSHKLCSTISKT